MRWPPRSSGLVALACLLLAPAAAAADTVPAGSQTLTSAHLTATLSWDAGEGLATNARLRLVRDGTQVLDDDLSQECQFCGTLADPQNDLKLADLDGDGEPEVLVDFYTGGAHCCSVTTVWYLSDRVSGTYKRRVLEVGNLAYRLRDLGHDGKLEIVTGDNSFAYEFAPFAFDWFPPLVLRWTSPGFADVTRRYPNVVRADLVAIRKALPQARKDGDARGLVAAYVADEFLLRRRAVGLRFVASELRRGDVRGDKLWPSGRKFRPALLKFLGRKGYG